MTRTLTWLAVVGLLLCCCVSVATARNRVKLKTKVDAYTDPQHADADFPVQGEYLGTVQGKEQQKVLAVQVIALGGHHFRAVGYVGGLPGAGWDGKKTEEVEATAQEGAVTFQGKNGTGTIKDGAMTVLDTAGTKIGQLNRVVRKSPTLGEKPPAGAIVLFDGSSADPWVSARDNKSPARMTSDGLLVQGANTRRTFGAVHLHVEFRLPYVPAARKQQRGNSGCYLQARYEVQILDSFGLEPTARDCGAIYKFVPPKVNMCLPPLTWQTYDIDFTPAAFDAQGKKAHNARITVRQNGVLVQDNVEVPGPTGGAALAHETEDGKPDFINLQDHLNEVRFRNIWVVEK